MLLFSGSERAASPRTLITIAVVFGQGAFVRGQHAIHMLTAHHSMFKVLLHLINVLFEHYEEIVHLDSLLEELQYLTVLWIDCRLCYVSNEAEVLLDTDEEILGREAGQKREFALQINLTGPHEDIELFRLDEVWTASHLPDKHV